VVWESLRRLPEIASTCIGHSSLASSRWTVRVTSF
jgi:hypothetical protein